MRTDYLLYALAVIFFILTALSLAFVAGQTQQSLSVIATVVLGLFSAGLGYLYRPKVKTTASAGPSTEVPTADTSDAHLRESHLAESVEKHVGPTVTPQTVTNVPSQLIAPMPFMTPSTPQIQTPLKSELTAIHGINEKRAAQLQELGIGSINALANAHADDLAKNLTISPKITRMWIGSAKKQKQTEN
jgi:predicted flap endonuclease-1-like 5' DNA nuclease